MNERLKPYLNETVLVQLRHGYQLVRRQNNRPEPMATREKVLDDKGKPLVQLDEHGKPVLDRGGSLQPVTELHFVQVNVIVGKVVDRGGRLVVQYVDPMSDAKIDADLPDDFIAYVSAFAESRVHVLGG